MTIVNVHPLGENDPEYLEALSKATPAEMIALHNQLIIAHGGAVVDNSGKIDLSNFQDPDAAAAASTRTSRVSRTVKIYGVDQTFSAPTALEVEKQIGAAYRAASAANFERGAQPRDPVTGQFASKELNAAEMYELEMKMKRGEISVPQFLAQSGELARHFDQLAKDRLGLDPNAVKEARFQQSWASASEEFLQSEAGSSWPGGDANREILGLKLAELGLTDAEDKVGALATAYAHLKAEGKLQANPELVKRERERFESATSHEELNALARRSLGMAPRQLWGR
jgi:hypothetical protein